MFEEVVRQCVEKDLVSGRLAVTDSTHVKANASRGSEETVDVREEAGNYWKRLEMCIRDRSTWVPVWVYMVMRVS